MENGSPSIAAILGNAPQIDDLRSTISRLSGFDAPGNQRVPTLLLEGETGTGKGLVARVIHESGPRRSGSFVDVNCAAIPDTMLEAELFGFEAGAFTDARRAKPGLFEAASGGTLFLDEIDSLSGLVQSKVLKAIEEKRVRRLGAITDRDVDVKLIAATQRDLKALVGAGAFRADLYHRLAVLVLRIPPLRERGGDVLLLAEHFLRSYAGAHRLPPKRLADSARAWLCARTWPGNIRELGHLMERVTLLGPDDEVGRDTLAGLGLDSISPGATRSAAVGGAASLDEAELIRGALARAGGNVVRAARVLGIGRNALRYRMRRLAIDRPDLDQLAQRPPSPEPARTLAAPQRTADAATPSVGSPRWELKPVAALALSLTFSAGAGAEPLDYEPWTAATRWDRAIHEKVVGFGGVFLQRSPSRMTAVFGVPRALEEMPLRAVQVGLAIQRAAALGGGPRPEIRAAVHAGEVRVDVGATDPVAGLLPLGDVLALPERLLGHAGPGEVLVSPQVARRVERRCGLEPRALRLGPRDADRLTAYAVVAVQAGAAAGRPADEALLTPFVGREREIEILRDAFARASAGNGQVVFIAGEAGIGKSRLLAEFGRRMGGTAHRWVEGRCASYGTTTPFFPVIDSLRRYLGVDDTDGEASATAKIAREVDRLGGDLVWTLPFVQQVLSLRVGDDSVQSLDSASRRSELFRALRALTLRAAEIDPLVLVVEDLHWIDRASEEYLAFVGDVIPTTRVLVILSHRSGYSQPFGDRSYHQRITLAPLSSGEAAIMTGSILGSGEIPAALRSLIARKAEGNPFFVEELTKSLLEEGSLRREDGRIVLAREPAAIAVPDTIQDVLIARIDRLAEESRRAIQVASVIGREFALRLLARISEAGESVQTQVEELRGLELIYEKAFDPELAYMFKHALTHEVAYESVVRERRKGLHRTIGRAIEELYDDRLAEHYETLAHHFSRGEDWERALRYHERSAEKAAATHANRAAAEHCREALAIAERLGDGVGDDVRSRLAELLGRACFYLSDYAASAAAYEQAAERSADPRRRALCTGQAAFSHLWAHQYDASRRCTDAAIEISRSAKAPEAEAVALAVRGVYHGVHDADLAEFDRCGREAAGICARHPHESVDAFVVSQHLMLTEWTGAYRDTVAMAEHAITLGRQARLPEAVIFATWFLGKARCCTGDYGGAITLLEEACQLCERIGDRAWRSRLLNTLGWCFAEIGAVARARDYNERAAALAREIGDPEILANASINLAANHLALGDLDRALEHLEPIETALARPGDPWMRWRYSLHAWHARAEVELARGEPEKALALASEEIAGAGRHRSPKIEARALALQGSALLALDRRDEAERDVLAALEIAGRIGYRRGVWRAYRLLSEKERRAGNSAAAARSAAQARQAAENAARTLADPELRRQLVASAADRPLGSAPLHAPVRASSSITSSKPS